MTNNKLAGKRVNHKHKCIKQSDAPFVFAFHRIVGDFDKMHFNAKFA